MWIGFHMGVVVRENRQEELGFGMANGLDDETIVAGEVEEGARFAGGAKLGENILGSKGQEIVGRVEVEIFLS